MIACISDVHIKGPFCSHYELLLRFLRHKATRNCKHIVLLGDIFDAFVGKDLTFYHIYYQLFNELALLSSQDRQIHFIEGNHDFNLKNFFNSISKVNPSLKVFHHPNFLGLKEGSLTFYFSHGDREQFQDIPYQVFRFFVKSWGARKIMEIFGTYKFISRVGNFLSETSRKYSSQKDQLNIPKTRKKFRLSAQKIAQKTRSDIIVFGHSHIKDFFEGKTFFYANNGLAGKEKTFLFLGAQKISFIPI